MGHFSLKAQLLNHLQLSCLFVAYLTHYIRDYISVLVFFYIPDAPRLPPPTPQDFFAGSPAKFVRR